MNIERSFSSAYIKQKFKLREKYKSIVDITFYIPCHNEELLIYRSLDKLNNLLNQTKFTFEFLIYNDGSSDKSLFEIKKFIGNHPRINLTLVNLKKSRGLGFNYQDGSHLGIGQYYMMICGDNAETEESILKILKNLGSAEILIPYFGLGDNRNLIRKFLSILYTKIVNTINGKKIKYYNGVVLHLRENVAMYSSASSGFGYQSELLSNLLFHNKSFKHISISNNDREIGFSRAFRLKNIFSVLHSLLQIFLKRVRHEIWPM